MNDPVEMFKAALAEVGYGHIRVEPFPSSLDGSPAIRCGSSDVPANVGVKAGALVALRLYGPERQIKCCRHTLIGVTCNRVTVAEALLNPLVECGA